MSKKKRKRKEDRSWIWMCAITGVLVGSLIVSAATRSFKSNSYHKAISTLKEIVFSEKHYPPTLKSLIVHPNSSDNYFDFVLDSGESTFETETQLKPQAKELIDYFFLGITLPSEDLWVNLNSVRQNEVTSPRLALTDIGKVLLEADLRLKKDCCRFTDPRTKTGREYWNKLQQRLNKASLSSSQLPIGNRFWIIPAEAAVEEDKGKVTIVKSKLKVCLEQEYLALQNNNVTLLTSQSERERQAQDIADFTMKEVVLPAIQHEVTYGKGYAKLRQVYNSLILAEYFKQKYWGGEGLYPRLVNRGYIQGLESNEPWSPEEFYNAYLKSAQEGEYRLTQTEYDPYLASMVQKYYFYGGILWTALYNIFVINEVTSETAISEQAILEDEAVSNGKCLVKLDTLNQESLPQGKPYNDIWLAQLPEGIALADVNLVAVRTPQIDREVVMLSTGLREPTREQPPGSPFSVFNVLKDENIAITVSEIAAKLGLSVKTVERDLSPMVKRGLIARDGPAKSSETKYRLTESAKSKANDISNILNRFPTYRPSADEWAGVEQELQILQGADSSSDDKDVPPLTIKVKHSAEGNDILSFVNVDYFSGGGFTSRDAFLSYLKTLNDYTSPQMNRAIELFLQGEYGKRLRRSLAKEGIEKAIIDLIPYKLWDDYDYAFAVRNTIADGRTLYVSVILEEGELGWLLSFMRSIWSTRWGHDALVSEGFVYEREDSPVPSLTNPRVPAFYALLETMRTGGLFPDHVIDKVEQKTYKYLAQLRGLTADVNNELWEDVGEESGYPAMMSLRDKQTRQTVDITIKDEIPDFRLIDSDVRRFRDELLKPGGFRWSYTFRPNRNVDADPFLSIDISTLFANQIAEMLDVDDENELKIAIARVRAKAMGLGSMLDGLIRDATEYGLLRFTSQGAVFVTPQSPENDIVRRDLTEGTDEQPKLPKPRSGQFDDTDATGKFVEIEPVKVDEQGRLQGIIENIDTKERLDLSTVLQRRAPPIETEHFLKTLEQFISGASLSNSERDSLERVIALFRTNFPNNIIVVLDRVRAGFVGIGKANLLVINQGFLNNPIAFLHEIIECLKHIHPEIITQLEALLDESGREWLNGHEVKYTSQGRHDYFLQNRGHYVIRAFTRQVFGEADKALTDEIKKAGGIDLRKIQPNRRGEVGSGDNALSRQWPEAATEPASSPSKESGLGGIDLRDINIKDSE
jgi:DNA-binding MarR family transcriptional regulator